MNLNNKVKNKKDIEELVRILVRFYSRDMKLKNPPKALTREQFVKLHPCRPMNDENEQGGWCPECNSMYSRIDNRCVWHICETVAHELVHVQFPDLQHGKKFDKIVANVITCEPKELKRK